MNSIKRGLKQNVMNTFGGGLIIYDGRKVYRSDTEDNNALYMLSGVYEQKKFGYQKIKRSTNPT